MSTEQTLPPMGAREALLWGAIGGMLPTIGRLAGTYAADFSTPPPAWFGVGMAVALYAIIGAVIARAMGDGGMRQALFAGIAAPAIVLSVLNGATESKGSKTAVDTFKTTLKNVAVSGGDTSTFTKMVVHPAADDKTTFLQDFVWGLGGSREAAGKFDSVTTILNRAVKQQKLEPNS